MNGECSEREEKGKEGKTSEVKSYVFWYKWYYWERIKILASAVLPPIHHLKRLPSPSPSPLNPHKLRHNMRQ
jgi:hypothetical protein